jgi:hypothetical protein
MVASGTINLEAEEINFLATNVTLEASGAFDITANTMAATASGGITLNNVTIDAAGALASPVSVTAPAIVGGSSVAAPSITVGGVEMAGHSHPYTWTDGPGTGETGPPQ